ncbi:intercellular adhesion molecule 5-like isoform X2 [Lithobates pipiens]
MELCVLWTLANIFVFSVSQVYGSLPIPVLHFEENIIEDEDTLIRCTLPYNDYPDVKLVIKGNATIKDCTPKKGNYPNVTCTVEVTREMHEMEFTCEAEFKTQSLPEKMNIQTGPEFTDCPDKLVWIEGKEHSFYCMATGYPSPTVTCAKNTTTYEVEKKFTAMRNMTGLYTCRARNFDMVKKIVNVSVEYKPKVSSIKLSPPLHGKGDKVEITCEADGVPDPIYSWKTPPSDLQFSADNQTVTIKSLQTSHLGNYQCIVENKHGTHNGTQKLNFAVKPKIVQIKVQPSTSAAEGANVTLTCIAEGVPPPTFSWETPTDVQHSADNSVINIWSAKKTHDGNYQCKVENKHGSATMTQKIVVKVTESKVNRGERQESVTATISTTMISTILLYYLY